MHHEILFGRYVKSVDQGNLLLCNQPEDDLGNAHRWSCIFLSLEYCTGEFDNKSTSESTKMGYSVMNWQIILVAKCNQLIKAIFCSENRFPMSRSLIQRISPFFIARIKQNHKILRSSSYYYSSSALHEVSSESSESPSPSPSPSLDAIHMTASCIKRMKELQASEESSKEKMLRLGVENGGCSGFQYVFGLDDKTSPDDRVFEREGVKLVIDNISYDFVKGATIDYVEELIRSAFQVTTNPSAVGGCSCKSSFMVKQ
ncbi:hypothetical protein CRYUN_Cryun16bG0101900 [Craigia yunnanensis]